jgi:6-hydroxynicotinate reductase
VHAGRTRVTNGGAPVYIWPGGGITTMVDVGRLPAMAFGSVPTPALVAPIEFTMPLSEYTRLGGYLDRVQQLQDVLRTHRPRSVLLPDGTDFPER